VALRQKFDLGVNLRPCKAFPGNPLNFKEGIDLAVFRENTEGLYVGVEFNPVEDDMKAFLKEKHKKFVRFADTPGEDMAISMRIFTRKGCERIVRAGFEYAKKTNRPSVTIVEKPNVIRETSGMMIRVAREVAKDYPGIELWETNIDAMCMWLVKNPEDYSVLVASNMFGDIISDLAAQLVGGLGFASSANIGENYAVFEPTHGSAPKYYGQYKVNPMAMLLTTRLMLEWLGEMEMAAKLEKGISKTISDGKVRTYDMGGSNTTLEMAEEVVRNM
jgi:3-isopropylmalate dehydrogenase